MEQNQSYSLVGTWRGSTGQTGMQTNIETTLNADMTFATTIQSLSGVTRTSGTYRLIGGKTIEFTNEKKWPGSQVLPGPLIGQPGVLDTRTARVAVIHNVNLADKDTSHFRFLDENTIVVQSTDTAPVTFRREGSFSIPPNLGSGLQGPSWGTTPSGPDQSMSSGKTMAFIFLAFVLGTSLLAFCSLPTMR